MASPAPIPQRFSPTCPTATETAALTPKRPQEPKPPFPYKSEEVTFANPKAKDVRLAGTLIIPPGEGPFPTVIFISGSGPQDRDETIFGHKPFLVIADYLARRRIASLRFDDRGVGKSTGKLETATSADFADDVSLLPPPSLPPPLSACAAFL